MNLLKKLAKAKAAKKPAKKNPAKKKRKNRRKPPVIVKAGGGAVVSRVNKRGTAKSKRPKIPGKPRTRRSLAPRGGNAKNSPSTPMLNLI